MSDERIIRNLRNMAWERAKGELRSMEHTFWPDGTTANSQHYTQLKKAVDDFIEKVESEGLHE